MRKLLILALGLVALIVAIPGKALAASPVSISLVANNANPFGPEVVGEVLGSKLVEKNQEVPTDLVDTIVLSSADETKGAESAMTKVSALSQHRIVSQIGARVLRL